MSCSSGGLSLWQVSVAKAQRGWNLQPEGGLMRLGGEPGMLMQAILHEFESGHGSEQAVSIGVQGTIKDVVDWSDFHNFTGVDGGDGVRHFRRQRQIMADKNDAEMELTLHIVQYIDDCTLGEDIERGRWFVQDHNLWIEQDAQRQQGTLFHATA